MNFRRHNTVVVAGIATMAIAGLTGCAGASGATESTKSAGIAMLSVEAEGSPWADLAWSAIEELDTDLETQRVAGVDSAAVVQQVRGMANQGYNPIVVMQDELGDAAIQLAPSYPDTQFIVVDSFLESDEPNVQTIVIDPLEAAFVSGVVIGNTTETDKIGFVGGLDVPNIERYRCGFDTGIASVNPEATLEAAYAGSFGDPTKGQEVANSLIEKGSDVVIHAAALTGLGVLKAAGDAGAWGIGVDVWQGDVAPGSVLWSALKDGKGAVSYAVESALADKFEAGQLVWDLSKGAALYDSRDFDALPAELQDLVEGTVADLESGALPIDCQA